MSSNRFFSRQNSRQGVENLTPLPGKNFPLGPTEESANSVSTSGSSPLQLSGSLQLSPLVLLRDALRNGEYPSAQQNIIAPLWTTPLSLRSLELVEAELFNQQYLPLEHQGPSLSQIATYEASIFRWRARRAGLAAENIDFGISLPRYVHYLASEIAQILKEESQTPAGSYAAKKLRWKALFPNDEAIAATAKRLERWAALLLDTSSTPESKYDRGHSLLIHNLIHSAAADESAICLPVDSRVFLSRLKTRPNLSNG